MFIKQFFILLNLQSDNCILRMDELVQKKGFNKRSFTLLHDRLKIERKEKGKTFKHEVKLDHIGFEKEYYAAHNGYRKYATIVILFMMSVLIVLHVKENIDDLKGLILIILIFISVLIMTWLGVKPQDDILLTGGSTNILLYRDTPNEEVVLNFIARINNASKLYIKNKYTEFDSTTDEQHYYATLKNLRDADIISAEEHQEYKSHFDISRLL